jgi:hypothetical protein
MAPEKRDWSVPGPIRALLWWPGVAFVLVMVAPEAAAVGITASGVALMALGAIVPMASRRLRRPSRTPTVGIDDRPTVEMPTVEMPRARRAA